MLDSSIKMSKHRNHVMPPRLEVPLDEYDCRYTQSFLPSEAGSTSATAFFDKFGFIIFRNVISSSQCRSTVDDMWELLKELDGVNQNDPDTWSKGLTRFGMPKGVYGLFRPSLLRHRQDPNVHRCFASILGKEDIVVNHDRWLLHPPTKNVDGVDNMQWETPRNIHLDLNPWDFANDEASSTYGKLSKLRYDERRSFITENNLVHKSMGQSVQGILNLCDITNVSNGGTIVVPGFHHIFDTWVEANSDSSRHQKHGGAGQFRFDGQDPLNALATHVTMREGSLLIWDQRLAHGSTPNRSSAPRCAIPIRFFDASILQGQRERAVDRSIVVEKKIKECGFSEAVTPLGRQVFGLELN